MSGSGLPPPAPPWTLRGAGAAVVYRQGVLVFVRYTESDVGAYDELFWLAPFQPQAGRRCHTVTRMYVSSELSVRGGRENWGMPKELARFEVSSRETGLEGVRVTQGEHQLAAFTLHWSRRSLPFDTRLLPRAARRVRQVLDGRCFETVPDARARLHPARFASLEIDAALFPGARSSRSRLGTCFRELELVVPAARIWPLP